MYRKYKKVQSLLKSYISPKLQYAVSSKFQISGKRNSAQILKDIIESPTRDRKLKMSITNFNCDSPIPFTNKGALSIMVKNKLTKKQYVDIRLESIKRNCDIYPPNEHIANLIK